MEILIAMKLDLELIREQKDYLLNEYNNKSGEEADLLLGVIGILDTLQMSASDQGATDMEVYGEELD